jgi:hypothetical protein
MNQSSSRIFGNAIKSILQNAFKLLALAFAWTMRLIGVTLSKIGDAIEAIVIKRSTL